MDPYTTWSLEPLQLAAASIAGVLYGVRVRALAAQRRGISTARVASFYGGVAVIVAALASPLDAVGETRLFAAHMLQHMLVGYVGPLLAMLGLTRAVLAPVLGIGGMWRLRFLGHPAVALPVWAASFYLWHLPPLYETALRDDVVHAAEHAVFITTGLLAWAPVLEPVPAPRWFGTAGKLVYLCAWRIADMPLAVAFMFGPAIYRTYERAPRSLGLSAPADASLGGVMEFGIGLSVFFVVFVALFLRAAADDERFHELVALGVPEARARHAVRYGSARALLERVRSIGAWPPVRAGTSSGPGERPPMHVTGP